MEQRIGSIETQVALSNELRQNWSNTLAVAVDTNSSISTADQASVTVAHTTSSTNRLMLVGVSMSDNGDSVSSLTYNGINLTLVSTERDPSGKARVEIWQLVAPDIGTSDVVVNLTGTAHKGVTVGVMTFTGVNQTTPMLAFAGDSGNSSTASTTVASALYDLVFGVVSSHKGTAATPDAGQTEYWDLAVNNVNGSGTIEAGAASVTNSWTVNSAEWAAAAVSIQADTNSLETVTLTSVQDAYIQLKNSTANTGTSGSMVVDRESTDLKRALVQFDLNLIPTGSTIQSATLKLQATSVGGLLNVEAYHVLESWTEGSVTWNESSFGTNWSTAGGAFNATTLDSIATDTAGQHTFDITALVQDWVDSSAQNYGVVIGSPDGGGERTITFDSREGTVVPVLEIVYVADNQAPVNTIPGTQPTAIDTPLVFSTANGNSISVADPDDTSLEVTLTTTNGTLTLNGVTGLSFSGGDGNADASMTLFRTGYDQRHLFDGVQSGRSRLQ